MRKPSSHLILFDHGTKSTENTSEGAFPPPKKKNVDYYLAVFAV